MLVIGAIDAYECNGFGHHELFGFLLRETNFERSDLRTISTSRPQFAPMASKLRLIKIASQ